MCALAVLLPALACATRHASSPPPAPYPEPPTWDQASRATYYDLIDQAVSLRDGAAEIPGPDRARITLARDFLVTGDLDGDGADEAAVLLVRSSAGSGSFVYLAALAARAEEAANVGTAFLGDRVQVRGARIGDGRVRVDVVQAGPDDALCCPSQLTTRVFALSGGGLHELASESRVTGTLGPAELEGVEWVLTHLTWNEPAPAAPEVTLVFDGGRASGSAGCNRYSADVVLGAPPGELAVGPVATTRRACPGPAMALETRYLRAFAAAEHFAFLAGQLALTGPDPQREDALRTMVFSPRPPAPPREE